MLLFKSILLLFLINIAISFAAFPTGSISLVSNAMVNIRSSSDWSSFANIENSYINKPAFTSGSTVGAWCAKTPNNDADYVQAGSFDIIEFTGVVIQGRSNLDQWVKYFKVEYSLDGNTWTQYSVGGYPMIFKGSTDRNTQNEIVFNPTFKARAIRVIPVCYHGDKCLRWDVYVLGGDGSGTDDIDNESINNFILNNNSNSNNNSKNKIISSELYPYIPNKINNEKIPDSVRHVAFEDYKVISSKGSTFNWPIDVYSISLWSDDISLLRNKLPSTITKLNFKRNSFTMLTPGFIPETVTHLRFDSSSSEPLPTNLIPSSVTHLEVGDCYVKVGSIPKSVRYLDFLISQSGLVKGVIPEGVVYLKLRIRDRLRCGVIPNSVTHLYIYGKSFEMNSIPNSVTHLVFYTPSFDGDPIPPKLIPSSVKHLYLRTICLQLLLEKGSIPDSVTHLYFYSIRGEIRPDIIPSSVTHLYLGNFIKHPIQLPPSVTHLGVIHSRDFANVIMPPQLDEKKVQYFGATPWKTITNEFKTNGSDFWSNVSSLNLNKKIWNTSSVIKFELDSNQEISLGSIPDNVTHIIIPNNFKAQQIKSPNVFPPTVYSLDLHNDNEIIQQCWNEIFPENTIKELTFNIFNVHSKYMNIDIKYIPPSVEHIIFKQTETYRLNTDYQIIVYLLKQLPPTVKKLTFFGTSIIHRLYNPITNEYHYIYSDKLLRGGFFKLPPNNSYDQLEKFQKIFEQYNTLKF
eukprot:gene8641-10638_t